MGEIVNLRRVKRARDRAAAAEAAAAQRALHGRTRGEREATEVEAARARRVVDGARLEDGAGAPPSPNPLPPAGKG